MRISDSPSLADALARGVAAYVESHPEHRSWVTAPGPLTRDVLINGATWLPWLRDGTRPGRRSRYQLLPSNSAPAVELLEDDLSYRSQDSSIRLDREVLAHLARVATETRHKESLIKLFVAAMMWGSGTSNGRGPRRTAEALSDHALADTLLETMAAIENGDLEEAHQRFRVSGVGEAFFTKWFWAASPGTEAPIRPLILDDRVRNCLFRLVGTHPQWARPRGGSGYVAYVSTMHSAAGLLPSGLGNVDAEKVEWLLFDRSNHIASSEQCLSSWLERSIEQ